MPKPEKLSPEAVKETEDKIAKLVETMSPFERATLYEYLFHDGMSLQAARKIRVKAGAVN